VCDPQEFGVLAGHCSARGNSVTFTRSTAMLTLAFTNASGPITATNVRELISTVTIGAF
jgi:hypothetical protein